MKNLLLLLIVLTLFGALVFFGLSIYEGSKDGDKVTTNDNNDDNTGGSDSGGTGTDNNGFKPSNPNTGGSTGGSAGGDSGNGSADGGSGTTDGGSGTTDNGTGTDDDTENLPSTALISDTADKVLISIVVILFGAVLIRTNLLGKIFFPLSEYFNADFFNIDSGDPHTEKRMQRQLRFINEAIKRRGSR